MTNNIDKSTGIRIKESTKSMLHGIKESLVSELELETKLTDDAIVFFLIEKYQETLVEPETAKPVLDWDDA